MLSLLPFHTVAIAVTVVLVSLIAYPLLIHIGFGWRRKADDIILAMSDKSSALYFKVFQNKVVPEANALSAFKAFYICWYGRRFLIFPTICVLLIAALSAYLLGETGEVALRRRGEGFVEADFFSVPPIASAAVVGAFAFSAWDIITRVARRNVTPADILGVAVRLAIAIPLGYAFSSLLKDSLGPFIAFAVGAFPLQTVQTVLQRLANRQLGLEIGADSATDQVYRLSGVDRSTADRIEDADITTIAQLAYCDPVQLSMRTNLAFAYVSDIVAQALAWIYLETRLVALRPIGFRGAVEIRNLMDDLAEQNLGPAPALLLSKAAAAAKMSEEEFRNVADEIAHDPYTDFLYETW